ncbi:unnamed protein product [Symbiodinium natans]|uniref:Uncharacterized protein n=1 Tax=Symbiodinium natans TaxID=878477 RepID=A0A812HZM7_9DINO|nr:unnamed protein product [Symbiodinium natans]
MSCSSLYVGMKNLEDQGEGLMATPSKVKKENEDDHMLGLSPETAELWKSMRDTPESKALKAMAPQQQVMSPHVHQVMAPQAMVMASQAHEQVMAPQDKSQLEEDTMPPAKRMKQEQAVQDEMNIRLAAMRKEMVDALAKHEEELQEATRRHRARMQQEEQEHVARMKAREAAMQQKEQDNEARMKQQEEDSRLRMQEERDTHEHDLALIIEHVSSVKAEQEARSVQKSQEQGASSVQKIHDDAKACTCIAASANPCLVGFSNTRAEHQSGLCACAKLNCLITFRTKTRKWRKNLQGYSWKTEQEMTDELKWSRVAGAMKYCDKRKLTKKDIYDPSIKKFLVLVRDDVESAEEKLQELQQEMVDMGLMSSDFELGDLLDDPDGSGSDGGTGAGTGGGGGAVRRKLEEFPQVEGDETLQEYLGQYRRAILSRKALVKVAKERLEKDQAKGYEYLAS